MADAQSINLGNNTLNANSAVMKEKRPVGGQLPHGPVDLPIDRVVISQSADVLTKRTIPGQELPLFDEADIKDLFFDDDLIGKTVGGYQLKGKLGSGGFGTVFLAEGPNGIVALKILNHSLLGDRTDEFFQGEVAALQKAKGHNNALQFVEAGQDGKYRYIATEYLLESEPLDAYISRKGALSIPEAMPIFRDAAVGLAGLHAEGYVHRDVKSQNIMVGKNAVVIDFGIAAPMDKTASNDGAVFGTPSTLSPEQTRGERLTPASDLFSLGIAFHKTLTGNSPFALGQNGFMVYKGLTPANFGDLPAKLRYWVMPELLALDPARRLQEGAFLAEDLDYIVEDAGKRYSAFKEAIDLGRDAAGSVGAPKAGAIVYFPCHEIDPDFETRVAQVLRPEEGYTVLRSDDREAKGIFVYSRAGKAEILEKKAGFLLEANERFHLPFVFEEIETAGTRNSEDLFSAGSDLVKRGQAPKSWEYAPGALPIDKGREGRQDPPALLRPAKRAAAKPVSGDAPTQVALPSANTPVTAVPQKAMLMALAAIWGKELAKQINDQIAFLNQDKLSGLERELQAKIRRMSNQEFADIMKDAGLLPSEARKIKGQLDGFEFKQLKTGFVGLASGLLSMTGVSCLLSKISRDMNPGLHFAVVMLGGHYTNNGVKALAAMIRNKEFMAGVRELAGSVKNGRIVISGLGRSALAALKAPLLTTAKAAGLAGKGIWAGIKSTHGLGLGTLSAAYWNMLMDGMGVKNAYVREGGAMAAFLAPDVAKLSARYLVTVKGFKSLSQLLAQGAVGTAARAANVVGWATFAAELTLGGIEHAMIKDAYTRAVIARAKEEWKNAQAGFFSIAGTIALDGMLGSFADAMVPENYLDKVKATDEKAVAAFMEEVGKGVFLAGLSGGSLEEVKGLLAGYLKQFGATPQGKEYFEGMQVFMKIKYGTNMTAGQQLLTELDVANPVITDKLLDALLVESTFDGKYVKAQLRQAAKAVEAGIPQS